MDEEEDDLIEEVSSYWGNQDQGEEEEIQEKTLINRTPPQDPPDPDNQGIRVPTSSSGSTTCGTEVKISTPPLTIAIDDENEEEELSPIVVPQCIGRDSESGNDTGDGDGDEGESKMEWDANVPLHNVTGNEGIEKESEQPEVMAAGDNEGEANTAADANDIPTTTTTTNGDGISRNMIIEAIDKSVVHQICSGQVIVTLATAVKELVENALDAGATSVEVKLVEYGSVLVEVIDNGSGVQEDNFQGLALKHHTSKLSQFEDLTSIGTFGFRGEALSSLAALCSSLTISTRSASSRTGFRLEYDSQGALASKQPFARERGTTVALKGLFSPLPVRHREFLKNLKREFHKMVNVLYAYALISKGVRMMVNHQHGNGSFSSIISIPSTNGYRERIVGLFGTKQLSSLVEFQQEEVIDEETLGEFGLTGSTFINDRFRVEGFLSKPNQGRSSHDRQFFFINSRPCDIPKVSKIVNEVYHTFSRHQSPFICLNIMTEGSGVDVNVTPDKRSLFIQSEKSLYAILKASLISLWSLESSSYSFNSSQQYFSQSQLSFPASQEEPLRQSSSSSSGVASGSGSSGSGGGGSCSFDAQLSSRKGRPESTGGGGRRTSSSSYSQLSISTLKERFAKASCTQFGSSSSNKSQGHDHSSGHSSSSKAPHPSLSRWITPRQTNPILDKTEMDGNGTSEENGFNYESLDEVRIPVVLKSAKFHLAQGQGQEKGEDRSPQLKEEETEQDVQIVYDDEELGESYEENLELLHKSRPSTHFQLDWEEVKERIRAKMKNCSSGRDSPSGNPAESKSYAQKFRAKISPGENEVAEKELMKQLTKEMFSKMEIIGQFNLGFILVKLGSDLFIVDQHASDEKYNFEQLQKSTVLQTQRLIRPMELQLPAVSENIILDHLIIFQKNGFDFNINVGAPPTQRISLSKIPFSKFTQFEKEDVEELIFMLEDSDSAQAAVCRPTKVRSMLASRACRKSVMIGTPLGGGAMRRILDHMGTMDQPWNCPHGRPTIRHLFNTNLLPDAPPPPTHLHTSTSTHP